ncbi:MAG: hypothetical protein Q9226_005260 [Calogaya cf. arnoldii]
MSIPTLADTAEAQSTGANTTSPLDFLNLQVDPSRHPDWAGVMQLSDCQKAQYYFKGRVAFYNPKKPMTFWSRKWTVRPEGDEFELPFGMRWKTCTLLLRMAKDFGNNVLPINNEFADEIDDLPAAMITWDDILDSVNDTLEHIEATKFPDWAYAYELELVVRYNRQRYNHYLASRQGIFWKADPAHDLEAKFNHLVRTDIIQALKLERIPVHGILDDLSGHNRFSKYTVWLDESIEPDTEQLPSKWAGSYYTGVELKTPVFLYQETAFKQLMQVIRLLDDNFSIFVNHTCGLHIHVGNGTHGLPFSTVKNLAILTTVFERQLNSLHPIHRIQNEFCRPLSQSWDGLDPILIAKEIEAFPNIEQFVNKLSEVYGYPDKFHAVNFSNLGCKDGTQTIEFRQHQGTTDPLAMIQWARLCCELVRYCYQAGEFGVLCFLRDRVDRADYSIIDLLTDIGLGGPNSLADYYEQEGLYQHPQTIPQAAEACRIPIITVSATEDSTPVTPDSSRPPEDPQLLLIKTLARDLGGLLAGSPEPDIYRTLDKAFAAWHKGMKSYGDLRDGLKAVYADTEVSFEMLDECLRGMKGVGE